MGNRFVPRYSQISDITNSQNAIVTFFSDHDFLPGQFVSFRVTPDFGMFQINNQRAKVLLATDDSITVNISTLFWDIFDISSLNESGTSPPVCVPCCSGVIPSSRPSTVILADVFDNIRT